MIVFNRKGTSNNKCTPCGSWISHWERLSGQNRGNCNAKGCSNKATLGAHVNKSSVDKKWYIVPFCDSHNKLEDISIELNTGTKLVPAVACN